MRRYAQGVMHNDPTNALINLYLAAISNLENLISWILRQVTNRRAADEVHLRGGRRFNRNTFNELLDLHYSTWAIDNSADEVGDITTFVRESLNRFS